MLYIGRFHLIACGVVQLNLVLQSLDPEKVSTNLQVTHDITPLPLETELESIAITA